MDLNQSDIDLGIQAIEAAVTAADLEAQRLHWMGRQGLITQAFKTIGALSPEKKPLIAKQLNEFKTSITDSLAKQKEIVQPLNFKKRLIKK